ncbi:MAG: RagB/SusD family nutrient uptake outer membrane protein, partial [Pelobium sp.]
MKKIIYTLGLCLGLGLAGCNEFLDAKPDKALLVPTTLADFQLLLNDDITMNVSNGLGILSDDDHFLKETSYNSLTSVLEKNSYIWAKDLFEGGNSAIWNTPYTQVFNANIVLAGLDKISPKPAEDATYQKLKGAAYFYRAWALFHTASAFASQYSASNAASVPGIPVYTKADVNLRPGRGTLKACYDQIQSDLKNALIFLSVQKEYLARPNKIAAFGLAARVHMSMADYVNAGKYADSALKYQNTLMDYNTISTTSTRPFTRTNVEVIYQNRILNFGTFTSTGTLIDSALYKSYATNDLRKAIYFKSAIGGVNFKGSYDGTTNLFAGLTVDELYL